MCVEIFKEKKKEKKKKESGLLVQENSNAVSLKVLNSGKLFFPDTIGSNRNIKIKVKICHT